MHNVCMCVHVCTHLISAGPHSPPRPSQKQRVDGRGWASVPSASGSGAIPKPLCFPSPPLCRPSSLFLFLFCCRFNFSSWTLSVLPERYLVSSLPVWYPPRSPSSPLLEFPPPQQDKAAHSPVVLSRDWSQSSLLLLSKALAPFCPLDCDFCPMSHQYPPPRGGLGRGHVYFAYAQTSWGHQHLLCHSSLVLASLQ